MVDLGDSKPGDTDSVLHEDNASMKAAAMVKARTPLLLLRFCGLSTH